MLFRMAALTLLKNVLSKPCYIQKCWAEIFKPSRLAKIFTKGSADSVLRATQWPHSGFEFITAKAATSAVTGGSIDADLINMASDLSGEAAGTRGSFRTALFFVIPSPVEESLIFSQRNGKRRLDFRST
jgi:hypothetical protein